MLMNLNGGNHLRQVILNLSLLLFNIGQKDPYLIEIKVYGEVGT
jgi:hypothetical protein